MTDTKVCIISYTHFPSTGNVNVEVEISAPLNPSVVINTSVSESELFTISGSQEWDESTVASAIRRYILALSDNVVTR